MDIADYMETEYNSYGWNESDVVRSEVYEQESWNSTRAGSHVQKIFAEELVALCVRHDFLTYWKLRSERPRNEGSRSQEDNRNYRFEHDGSGDAGKTGKAVNFPQGHSPAGFCALFMFVSGAALLQYGFAGYTEFGNEADIDVIRRDLYAAEKQSHRTVETLKYSLGEKFFRLYS